MTHMSILLYAYAAVLLLGGAFGYAKAKSRPSLIAGILSAAIAAAAGALAPHHPRLALAVSALLAVALIVVFARRYQATKNAVPAIPMIIVSLLVLIAAIYEYTTAGRAGA